MLHAGRNIVSLASHGSQFMKYLESAIATSASPIMKGLTICQRHYGLS